VRRRSSAVGLKSSIRGLRPLAAHPERVHPSGGPTRPESPGRLRAARLAFWGTGLTAAVVLLFVPTGPGTGLIGLVAGLLSMVAVVSAVQLHRPGRAGSWLVLAAGLGLWSAADAVSALDVDPMGADTALMTSLSGAGYLMVIGGLVLLTRRRRIGNTLGGLLSPAVTTGLALLVWALLSDQLSSGHGATNSGALVGISLAGDIVVTGKVAGLIATPGRQRKALGWMLAAASLRTAAHVVTVELASAPVAGGHSVGLLLLASTLAWGAAGLSPAMAAVSRNAGVPQLFVSRFKIGAVIVAMLVPMGALVLQHVVGNPLTLWPMAIGSVVMPVIVAAWVVKAVSQVTTANRAREDAQHELAHQAAHDSLTGVPNRAHAMQLIYAALSRAQRSGAAVGLLFVDLDGFKAINDSLGHGAGDEVLRCVAGRMQAEVRAGDVVGRLGGDEFIVLLEPLDEEASAVRAADRLVKAISAPITLSNGRQIGVGASVGVAISQDAGTDPEALLHEADVAVYRAKATGRGHTEVFDLQLRRELKRRTEIEAGLVAAIENDGLVVHYQPIVNVLTGDVLGYEALVRWRRPGGGLIPPGEFILVAEQSDLICELDCWVLRQATQQLASWNAELGSTALFIAVNVSGRHIVRPRLCDDVEDALQASGIEPRQLVLEITETALIDDSLALANLETLRGRGVSISIDDFGSGYNSIARLEQLPVDIVKIDSRFLNRGGPSTDKLLRLIVQAAHAFGLPVVAEGVEHPDQLERLRSIECESAQGYYLGLPADPAAVVLSSEAHAGLRRLSGVSGDSGQVGRPDGGAPPPVPSEADPR
jgi:diguanylate cyclase (GGDEF)-like protein